MTIKDNYPTVRPSLLLDFANRGILDPRVDFTRSTTATYFDINGVLRTANAGEPRFDHDPVTGRSKGLLVEEQRTNLLINSDTPATQTVNSTSGKTYTLSVVGTGSADITVGGSGQASENSPLTFDATGSSIEVSVSGTVDRFQLERGEYVTSYISTEGSQVTRGEDTVKITDKYLMDFIDSEEGTLYAEGDFREDNTLVELGNTKLRDFPQSDGSIVLPYRTDPRVDELKILSAGTFSRIYNYTRTLSDRSAESFRGYDTDRIAEGFIQRENLPSDFDIDLAVAIELNLLGAPVAGGYYAGLIDTIAGTIISTDDYQTGQRYALIVAPKDLEGGLGSSPASGLPTGILYWDTQDRNGPTGSLTRWNGLDATNVIIAKNEAAYEVHNFIADVRAQYPAVTTPGGTEWYLPAMDELELLYRNFKPNNADNAIIAISRNFPGTSPSGYNPASVPEGFQYENNPRIPDVTYLDLFKENAAQSLDLPRYWSTTSADEGGGDWHQRFTASGEGLQVAGLENNSNVSVRPVRRVVL